MAQRLAQIPESVRIELDRSRRAIGTVLGAEAVEWLAESLAELRSQGADAALLMAIVRRVTHLAPRLAPPGGLQAWLTAVREVMEQARHCIPALLENSEAVLRHASPTELLMWARLGLRQGQWRTGSGGNDPALAHFELRSRESALVVSGESQRVDLASSKARLSHLLRALFDVAPTVLPVEQGLATRRPFLSNLGLHLPEAGRALRGAHARRWYDAAAAHAAAHLRYSTHKFERGSLKPVQLALLGLLEDARVEALSARELPGLRRLWLSFHSAEPAHGDTFVVLMLRLARSLLDPDYDDPHPWVVKARLQFLAVTDGGRAPEKLTPTLLREMASTLGNDIGQMRLQFNYREYVVEPAYRDDNVFIWMPDAEAQAQTLAAADALPVPPDQARAPEMERESDDGEASTRARSRAMRESDVEQISLARAQYPEWDRLIDDYRSAWATVLEDRPAPAAPGTLLAKIERQAALLTRLERVLRAGQLRERVKLRAQLVGDELDVDAAVRSQIDRRSHHPPNEKVHQRLDRRERDVSALVLLDSSTSTADLMPSGGSILDLAREAAVLTASVLSHAGDRCAIHAFSSNGRREVRYESALAFDEHLDAASLARLAGVNSRGSTRMGAALRHATALLAGERSRKRLLLFITDGEPHDIDIHDRRYLIEDARRAVLEARRRGLAVFCVTLDPAADGYVRTIFGTGNFRVLDRIESLPRILPAMVMRLAH